MRRGWCAAGARGSAVGMWTAGGAERARGQVRRAVAPSSHLGDGARPRAGRGGGGSAKGAFNVFGSHDDDDNNDNNGECGVFWKIHESKEVAENESWRIERE